MALSLAAPPAVALDKGGRLVPGGASGLRGDAPARVAGEARAPLLTSGGFSVGAVAAPAPSASGSALPFSSGRGNLAVGGYVAYGLGEANVSTSLSRAGSATMADIAAAYSGSLLGVDGTAALRLGAAWAGSRGFSPNPMQLGSILTDPTQPAGEINLSLSLTHQVTPSFSLGGVAEASRPNWLDTGAAPGGTSGFMLGAGMGYRF